MRNCSCLDRYLKFSFHFPLQEELIPDPEIAPTLPDHKNAVLSH